MTSTIATLEQDLSVILGINDLPEAEQALFLNDIGALMLEGALLKFLVVLSESDQEALLSWMEQEIASEKILPDLIAKYPQFESFLVEEIHLFKTDAMRIMSTSSVVPKSNTQFVPA